MITFYLLRHGKTVLDGRYIGSTDCVLSDEGEQQIKLLSPAFTKIEFSKVISSPMKRCIQTFDLLGINNNLQIVSEIREINFGDWEKKSFHEVFTENKNLTKVWQKNPLTFQFPSGEGIEQFLTRIKNFYSSFEIIEDEKNQNILIILISYANADFMRNRHFCVL